MIKSTVLRELRVLFWFMIKCVLLAEPGTFEFSKPSLLFKESVGKAQVPIERINGADGKVEIKWKTEDMSAHSGHDYEGGDGTLIFEHGETTKTLEIPIYDDQVGARDRCLSMLWTSILSTCGYLPIPKQRCAKHGVQ